jgi:hypothetical protein
MLFNVLLGATYSVGGGIAYTSAAVANKGNAKFWEWNEKDPSAYIGLLSCFNAGSGWPTSFKSVLQGAGKALKNLQITKLLKKPLSSLRPTMANMKSLGKGAFGTSPLYKVIGAASATYLSGALANQEFDPREWKSSYQTYEGLMHRKVHLWVQIWL